MPKAAVWDEAEANDIIRRHDGREGAMLPILHDLQDVFGCIPPAAVRLVAEALNRTRAEVHGVVSFYHDFREQPAGRHVLKICRAEACQSMNGEAVARQALDRFGLEWGDARWPADRPRRCRHPRRDRSRGRTMTRIFVPRDAAARAVGADRVATAIAQETRRLGLAVDVVRTGSRGLFWLEPMIEVETPGGRIAFGPMTVKDVPGLFAGGLPPSAAHPLCVGRPEDIPFLKRQTRITFARCGIVDPLSLADYRAHGGYRGLERARSLGAAGTVDEVVRSGLRGRGGAGFPTGIKWKTVADTAADRKFIVCNADEGDSGTYADRMIMEGDPFLLIEGMTIAGFAVGATKGYIYIRSEYPDAIRVMERAIVLAEAEGLLGTKADFEIEVRVGAGAMFRR